MIVDPLVSREPATIDPSSVPEARGTFEEPLDPYQARSDGGVTPPTTIRNDAGVGGGGVGRGDAGVGGTRADAGVGGGGIRGDAGVTRPGGGIHNDAGVGSVPRGDGGMR